MTFLVLVSLLIVSVMALVNRRLGPIWRLVIGVPLSFVVLVVAVGVGFTSPVLAAAGVYLVTVIDAVYVHWDDGEMI